MNRKDLKELPLVDVIASGYEWTCPCGELNEEMEYKAHYTCGFCAQKVKAAIPEHAYG